MKKYKLSVTCDTSGAGSATGPNLLGICYAIAYKRGTLDATTTDITVSTVNSDGAANQLVQANITADKVIYPRTLEHLDTDGSNLTTHTYPILAGTIKFTVAQGGNGGAGSVVVFYQDEI